jgi:integrase
VGDPEVLRDVLASDAMPVTPEAARLLRVGRTTVYALMKHGHLRPIHIEHRRGEALSLRWADVDFDRGTLRVRGTLARIDGALVVTEPRTAESKRVLPLSDPAERLLRGVQDVQATERERAGSAWRETGYVFTTETGEPCDPRNAP